MTEEIEKICAIYERYGFAKSESTANVISFVYLKSRYFGIDIIPLNNSESARLETDKIKSEYTRLGFAVAIKEIKSAEQAELELYKSFFSYSSTISRLQKKYESFVGKQTRSLLGSQYEYIESPFQFNDSYDDQEASGLMQTIEGLTLRKGPQLIIIEAAAGYGKTCAAYEILNRLTRAKSHHVTPLFTELAKNRGAKIFRYILLDEIDSEFPTLNSDLVIHEVKNGRIPLIIDGFDELLEKVNISDVDITKTFDEIESMLDTIGALLERDAKIVLTTRKTAIFTGMEFDRWINKWNNKFQVSRLTLKEPKIKDWLGDRYKLISQKNIPIQYIANPVLLSYLKNLDQRDFENQLENPELLIEQYFNRLLEREKERQNLIITVEKQLEIFRNVVKLLLEFDITVESKQFFKDLIRDENSRLLEYTRTLYSGVNRPSVDNLIDTLATHALLDRKGRGENQIGFINDFVLGVFIGEIIIETPVDKIEKDYSYYMLDLACTAYKVQNQKNKGLLWDKVNSVIHKLQPISVFTYDITLKESLQRNYEELSIYDTTFFKIVFKDHLIKNTVFLNCYFRGCAFDTTIFHGVSFVDCIFDQCEVINEPYLDGGKEISTIKCRLKQCEILQNYEYHSTIDHSNIFTDFEKQILEQLFSSVPDKAHRVIQLLQFFGNKNKIVLQSLEDLEERGFLRLKGNHIYLEINKISTIKNELGYV